jgi:hypothetical protein
VGPLARNLDGGHILGGSTDVLDASAEQHRSCPNGRLATERPNGRLAAGDR